MIARGLLLGSLASRLGVLGFTALGVVLTTHALGASGQGTIAILQLGMLIAGTINGMVAGGAVVHLQRSIPLRRMLVPGHAWLAVSSLAVVALEVALGLIPADKGLPVSVFAWLQGVVVFHGQIAIATQQFRWYNALQLVQTGLLALGLTLAFGVLGIRRLEGFLAALALALGTTALVSLRLLRSLPHPDPTEPPLPLRRVLASMASQGGIAQLGSLFQLLTQRLNVRLLSAWLPAGAGLASAGLYSVAYLGMEAMWTLARGWAPVVHGKIAHLPGPENRSARLQLTRRVLLLTWASTLPLALLAAFLPDAWYAAIFHITGLQNVLRALLPAVLAGAGASILAHHLSGIGAHAVNALTSALGLAVMLACSALWIPEHGALGAAWAASVAGWAQFLGQAIATLRRP